MSIFKQGRLSAAARFHAVAWIIFLSMAHTAPGWAEAGEKFTSAPTAPAALPVAVADDGPSVGAVIVRRDPPRMEAARGARLTEALAKSRRVEKPQPAAKPLVPNLSAEPVAETARAPSLIASAAAAEPGKGQASSVSVWRRWLASPYTAWIAAVLLIGVPLAGVLRRSMADWREARDLVEYD